LDFPVASRNSLRLHCWCSASNRPSRRKPFSSVRDVRGPVGAVSAELMSDVIACPVRLCASPGPLRWNRCRRDDWLLTLAILQVKSGHHRSGDGKTLARDHRVGYLSPSGHERLLRKNWPDPICWSTWERACWISKGMGSRPSSISTSLSVVIRPCSQQERRGVLVHQAGTVVLSAVIGTQAERIPYTKLKGTDTMQGWWTFSVKGISNRPLQRTPGLRAKSSISMAPGDGDHDCGPRTCPLRHAAAAPEPAPPQPQGAGRAAGPAQASAHRAAAVPIRLCHLGSSPSTLTHPHTSRLPRLQDGRVPPGACG
jgi:hypothetical protein